MKAKRGEGRQKRIYDLTRGYMEKHGVEAVDPKKVAHWIAENNLLYRRPYDPIKELGQEISRALAAQYITDPQGREVRGMIPIPIDGVNGQRQWDWAPIFRARKAEFHLSQQVRRNGIKSGVQQHATDTDSYNDNNIHGGYIEPFDYNFNKDLEEDKFPTEYPEEPDGPQPV